MSRVKVYARLMEENHIIEDTPETKFDLLLPFLTRTNLHLVLDLDDTLIFSSRQPIPGCNHDFYMYGMYIYQRPGLGMFLRFCFATFASVNIWSHASERWVEKALRNITPDGCCFGFVHNENHATKTIIETKQCTIEGNIIFKNVELMYKNMNDVWSRSIFKRPDNTIIVDDISINHDKHPYNLIEIPPFRLPGEFDDKLFKLISFLHGKIEYGGMRDSITNHILSFKNWL